MTDSAEMFAQTMQHNPDQAISWRLRALIKEGKAIEIAHNGGLTLSGVAAALGGVLVASGVATAAVPGVAGALCYVAFVGVTAVISGNVKCVPFLGNKRADEVAFEATTGVNVSDGNTKTWLEYLPEVERTEVFMLATDSSRRAIVASLLKTPPGQRLETFRRWQESLHVTGMMPNLLMAAMAPVGATSDWGNSLPASELKSAAIEPDEEGALSAWEDEPISPIATTPEKPQFYRALLKVPFLWIKGRSESYATPIALGISRSRIETFQSKSVLLCVLDKGVDIEAMRAAVANSDEVIVLFPERIPSDRVDSFTFWELASKAKCLTVVSDGNVPGTLTQLINGRDRADIIAPCERDEFGALVPANAISVTRSGEKKEEFDGSGLKAPVNAITHPSRVVLSGEEIAPTREAIAFPETDLPFSNVEFAPNPVDASGKVLPLRNAAPIEPTPEIPEGQSVLSDTEIMEIKRTIEGKMLTFIHANFQQEKKREWYDVERKDQVNRVREFINKKMIEPLKAGEIVGMENLRSARWVKAKGGTALFKESIAPEFIKMGFQFDGDAFYESDLAAVARGAVIE